MITISITVNYTDENKTHVYMSVDDWEKVLLILQSNPQYNVIDNTEK